MDTRTTLTRYWEFTVQRLTFLPLIVFGASLLLTALSAVAVERSDRIARQLQLQVETDRVAAALDQNIATSVAILRSGRALFAAVDLIDLPTFQRFVGELRASGENLGVRGVGWSITVKPSDVATLEREMRAKGVADFRVWPRLPPPAKTEQAIIFLEPMDKRNRVALGFDMLSEPKRRAAMQIAAATGLPSATAPITLIQDVNQGNPPGLLIYVPVYRGDEKIMNAAARDAALEGYVYSPIKVSDFVDAVNLSPLKRNANIRLFDETESPRQMIYGSDLSDAERLTASHRVGVANRYWSVELSTTKSKWLATLTIAVLAWGTILSLLLATLTWLILLGGRNANAALAARQEFESVRQVLTRELTHRVKNTLATVTSLAMLTRRGATSVDGYVDAFSARLRALSATHDLLTQRDWTDAPMLAVLEAEFAPYCNASDVRLDLAGPDVILSPNIALSFGLAIHELVTNAAKYGALSVPNGSVSVEWVLAEDSKSVDVVWQETGGPTVATPTYRGFGSDLVEKLMARDLKSDVKIQFNAEGVRCALRVPIHLATIARPQDTAP